MSPEVEAVASELERELNTGSRVYVVDRGAFQRAMERYAAFRLEAAEALVAAASVNHDPGDEDPCR